MAESAKSGPYSDTRLVKFLDKRILELKPRKTLASIAKAAGFRPNVVSMLRSGTIKVPLDRVPALAKALDCDPSFLFTMAVEQLGEDMTQTVIRQIFGVIVTKNEAAWVEELRKASDFSDPALTARSQRGLRVIFGK